MAKKTKEQIVREFAAKHGLEIVEIKAVSVAKEEMMGLPKMVERVTIFGRKFMEAEDTPYYCSPRSETYWCS